MLSEGVINYLAALYGVLVGILLPLLYLHGKLYFRKNRMGLRVFFAYLGRLGLVLLGYFLLVGVFVAVVEAFSAVELGLLIESPSYLVGCMIGFVGAVALIIVGLRQARKGPSSGGRRSHDQASSN